MTETELFRIKPLEWELYEDGRWMGRVPDIINSHFYVRRFPSGQWTWWHPPSMSDRLPCTSPEEGKQLAEAHWREYIKQALTEVDVK